MINDKDGNVLSGEESVLGRWKEYFEELMNQENESERRLEEVEVVNQEVPQVSKEEVRAAIWRMKCGKAVGPDDIPVETCKCLGETAVEFLTGLFNRILEGQKMPEEWRRSIMVPIFKNTGTSLVSLFLLTQTMWKSPAVFRQRFRWVRVQSLSHGDPLFKVHYLGTDKVYSLDVQQAEEALGRLLERSPAGASLEKEHALVVRSRYVEVKEISTGRQLTKTYLRDIAYCTADAAHPNVFLYCKQPGVAGRSGPETSAPAWHAHSRGP
ncbi:uncharacterized protein LOC143518621 [Brachyhypopomus gauderio]|uniref:uncharacterized protein LOC143518621 n=1 Tax=Brachyhypopomus gauderio TaxID=698409 RepID=UPI0040417DEC